MRSLIFFQEILIRKGGLTAPLACKTFKSVRLLFNDVWNNYVSYIYTIDAYIELTR